MANLYGVDNICFGTSLSQGPQQTCPANTDTLIFSFALNPPGSNGFFTPVCYGYAAITLGATPPSSLAWGFKVLGGSYLANLSGHPGVLIANNNFSMPMAFGPFASLAIQNPTGPTTFQVYLQVGNQPVTCANNGSFAWCFWIRAPDQ